jgi:CRP/FNR family transcriptional regulator, cyclic AMP receptor protein
MACQPEVLRSIPLFSLLDPDEMAVLAQQVEIRKFARESAFTKWGTREARPT